MLGIVISASSYDATFDKSIYHKFENRTIFEHTIDNALKAEQAQRVVISVPANERKNIKGGAIYKPLVKGNSSYLGRRDLFHFHTDENDILGGLYYSALSYGLDHIVLINANCPILPTWLINAMIYKYLATTDRNTFMYNCDPNEPVEWEYDFAFQVQIFPFWMLADQFLYADDRTTLNLFSIKYPRIRFPNNKGNDFYLPKSNIDLRFTNLDRREEFDFLLNELAKGADLGELIEDLNEPKAT